MSKNEGKVWRTAVLMGGESEEREISLMSGSNIAEALKKSGIEAETYDWNPHQLADFLDKKYDRVFIALHGGSGENGQLQAMLDMAGIPFTGVRMQAASICMDKNISKTLVAAQTEVLVPECRAIPVGEARKRLASQDDGRWSDIAVLTFPLIVKPARNGSSVGVTLVEAPEMLDDAVRAACLSDDETVMFEQYIEGYELTVAMLNGHALGVCQIIPKNKFYDYDAKYNRNDTEYLTPSALGADFDETLCRQAEAVAQALDCTIGVVRIDFLADRALNPYFLEVNTVPGMTSHSLVPKIASHAGIDFPTLCRMILEMAH